MGTLKPYLALTQAVRQGDLVEFNRVVKEVQLYFSATVCISLSRPVFS